MAGTINSLGIGSGVLTADVIDKLKNNEKSVTIDPIKEKITLTQQKKQALDLLSSLMTTIKSSTSSLADDTLFATRQVSGNNSSVNVTASDGVDVQSFSISNISLAKESVQQSGVFASSTSTIASSDGTMNLNINGQNYAVDYTAGMTLEEFRDKINEVAGDSVTASILQIGDGQYSLIVKSDQTGKDQNITMTDLNNKLDTKLLNRVQQSGNFSAITDTIATSNGSMTINVGSSSTTINYDSTTTLTELKNSINSDANLQGKVAASIVEDNAGNFKLILNPIGSEDGADISISDNNSGLDSRLVVDATNMTTGSVSEVQSAKDASFTYNGINLTRSSNKIDDVIVGVNIELLSDGGSANISIGQDRQPIKDELQNFVQGYNSMVTQLDKMLLADKEEQKVGIFNGDSSIRNLGRELTRMITGTDANGQSLTQFGINLNKDGTLSFDSSAFDDQMDKDPSAVQKFFSGETTTDQYGNIKITDGIFDKLDNKLKSYVGLNGTFQTLQEGLKTEEKQLNSNYDKSLALLNAKYDSMTQQFVEYDTIISKLNAQFSALQQQIQMAINAKN